MSFGGVAFASVSPRRGGVVEVHQYRKGGRVTVSVHPSEGGVAFH